MMWIKMRKLICERQTRTKKKQFLHYQLKTDSIRYIITHSRPSKSSVHFHGDAVAATDILKLDIHPWESDLFPFTH